MRYIVIIILFYACKSQNQLLLDQDLSNQILIKQGKTNPYAVSAFWARKKIHLKKLPLELRGLDTIFLIERIGDPDLNVWANIWTSKRGKVIEYLNESGSFQDTIYNYLEWDDPLKSYVESFDTSSIDRHIITGGYRTFITLLIGNKDVKTFFFHDPKSSFRQPKYLK